MLAEIMPLQRLQDDITEWADKTFGRSRYPQVVLRHMLREVEETIKAPLLEEFADIGILWLNAAVLAGYSVENLIQGMVLKTQANKNRQWGKPDEYGVVEHLR